MEYVYIVLLVSLMGITKAISDIVDHIDIWKGSVFSRFNETSFFGPKDITWERKDHKNRFINYLQHTILVFITDVWHFSNFINNLCYIFVLLITIYYFNYYFIIIYIILRPMIFHIFYHYILVLNEKKNK